ncbi:Sir2 family NAD-dependent protein deacetylase [Georgenia sp. Z1344]|uniref:Sir2 family NAD-dependent protein deacetylase n=1 Tax=Georgenia sp. Z1344 TaxID=3416706 RepID=UPI003CF9A1AD
MTQPPSSTGSGHTLEDYFPGVGAGETRGHDAGRDLAPGAATTPGSGTQPGTSAPAVTPGRTSTTTTPRLRLIPPPPPPPAGSLPPEPTDIDAAVQPLADALDGRRFLAITGAGISTDSGIPDYRSPGSPVRRPITYQQFLTSPAHRAHYWARNHLGWRYMADRRANLGHRALAQLERERFATGVVTQNIDLLHARAGQPTVVHLHGRYDRVRCLSCGRTIPRAEQDDRLVAANPGWRERLLRLRDVEVAPDADAVLEDTTDFHVVDCEVCGGVLVPDVVFFGGTADPSRTRRAAELAEASTALLVAGSTLSVFGVRRIVNRMVKAGFPLVVINRGPTRADDSATATLSASTTRALPALDRALRERRAARPAWQR